MKQPQYSQNTELLHRLSFGNESMSAKTSTAQGET